MTPYVFFAIIGYLSGSILFARIVPKHLRGVDVVRLSDDGNPGTANAFAFAGPVVGSIVLFLELAKGFAPVYLAAQRLDTANIAFSLVLAAPVLGHAPYTLNACALDEGLRAFARDAMREDVMTLDTYLPHMLYNFHPGSHVGQGIDVGMGLIVELLDAILRPEQTTRVLLETMSGKGTEVGSRFEELGHILRSVSLGDKMGVCLDTCHVYSAGYDIVNDLDGVLEQFDRHVGLGKLYAIHLNDSLMPFASRKDRHARIGEGTIGLEAIARIINHPALRHLPFYLETPNELPGYAHEISILRAAWVE